MFATKKNERGKFCFFLIVPNEQSVVVSEGYKTEATIPSVIESVNMEQPKCKRTNTEIVGVN